MSDGEHHECHDPANPRAWTCRGDDDCIPSGPDAGPASFGGRPARLFDAGDGRWLVVAEGGDVSWEVLSSGLSREAALTLAADFTRVGR